ncbi:MAG TPA: ribonuclease D [Rhodospirillales bacterium]|nr:ribonuclease D [Rhodospirillales bacterium]HIN76817.1 ribonuclease D [Rhodospirillales bacterium]
MAVIADSTSLTKFCDRLIKSSYITVDTEFMRDQTYWPRLCLVQIANDHEAAAIDTLAKGIDITPLLNLLTNPRILKIFHAARQDLEIFYRLMGRLPSPIFDTQIAAMVCGFGDSAGYDTLVRKLTDETIDKSSRFTDWALRPLSQRQINYALGDVTHLRQVYIKLNEMLGQNNRHNWMDEELSILRDTKNYTFAPEDAWRRIKYRAPKPRFLAILKEVAAWREIEAQNKDIPRNRIVRDESLIEISHHAPKTINDLSRARGLSLKKAEGSLGKALLNAVKAGLNVPSENLPEVKRDAPLPKGIGPITDLLKVLLKLKCEKHDVAQKLIATVNDMEQIAAFGQNANVPALQGWRQEVFGIDALRLRSGQLAMVIKDHNLELVEINN